MAIFTGSRSMEGLATNCFHSGGSDCGTLFKLTPGGRVDHTLQLLLATKCCDGANPASLIQASNGNFYGATLYRWGFQLLYAYGCGTFFKSRQVVSSRRSTPFASWRGCPDGEEPNWTDPSHDGNFYGVAYLKGAQTRHYFRTHCRWQSSRHSTVFARRPTARRRVACQPDAGQQREPVRHDLLPEDRIMAARFSR